MPQTTRNDQAEESTDTKTPSSPDLAEESIELWHLWNRWKNKPKPSASSHTAENSSSDDNAQKPSSSTATAQKNDLTNKKVGARKRKAPRQGYSRIMPKKKKGGLKYAGSSS
jgi:hypothetical protein